MQKFLKKGIAIITFVSLVIQTCGGANALELKILDPKIEGSFPDWGNLGEVTDLNKTYSDLVTDRIRAVKEQNDIGINEDISEKEKDDIIANVGKTSEETLSVPIEEVDTKWKKRMMLDGLQNVDEKIIEGLKKSQIIDTFIDSENNQETIANPTLEDQGENLTTKATAAEIVLGKDAELEKKISFSGVVNGEEKLYEVGYRPLSADQVEANVIENKAIYENIWKGADVVLTAESDGFKEDIILKERNQVKNIDSSGYQGDGHWIFYYDLNLQGLTAKLDNNQVIYLDENNQEMARVTAPIVIDNVGEVSSRAYWDLISKETWENGYQIDKEKFGQEEILEEDLTKGAESENNLQENDLTSLPDFGDSDLSTAAEVQSNSVWQDTWQSVGKWWKSIFSIFGAGKAQQQGEEENDLSETSQLDQTTAVTPVEQIGLTNQNQEVTENSLTEKDILVLVVDTNNLTYPIDVDPTTYILTQSDFYNTANGKLSSNNVNDVKVYDTTKEPTSNYSYNKEIKSTLAFNNTVGEFDLSAVNKIAYWNLDENSGSIAEDDVTPAANASLVNNPGWTTGKIGRALDFDGNEDYLQINDDNKLSFGGNNALSVWINPENLSLEQGILGKGTSGNWEYYLGTTVNGGLQYTAWQLNGNEYFALTAPSKTLKANEWSQIVITNNDGNEAQLWVNGKLIKKTTSYSGSTGNGTSDLNIGRANNNGEINYFTGKIDNIGLFAENLNEGQIKALYNNGLSKIVGLWSLNGVVSDYSGQNNELSNGGAVFDDNGHNYQAMNFDGADWLNAGNSKSLSSASGFSLETWVKIPVNGVNQKLIEKNNEYSLNICPDGRPVLMINTNYGWSSTAGTGNSCIDSTAPIVTDDVWHNLLGTYDGKILRLYVDGKQTAYYYAPGSIVATTNNLLIGQNTTGSIDEVAAYARPLSSDEAELHFGLGYQSSVSTIINLDNEIGYAEYSQLALDNLQVEQTGVLQIKGIGSNGEAISEKIKLRNGNLQRVLSAKRYKAITELSALNEDGNTSEKSLKISSGKLLAFSPFHDANWRYGITKVNDYVTGLWNFDEGEGNIAEDNSGSNNTAYLAGGQSNNNWLYERNIDISPATTIDDYQLKVEFNPNNFDYIKAQDDGGDIRFFNNNGVELSYWIENWNTSGISNVWVKIPNSGTSSISMKYGNQSATNKSNGENVFDFFDDFSGNTINNDKWVNYDNAGYLSQDGKLITTGGSGAWGSNGLISKTTFLRNNNYELNLDYKPISGNDVMFGWHDSGTGTSYTDLVYAYYSNSANVLIYEDGNNRGTMSGSWVNNTEYKIKVPVKTSGGATYKRSVIRGEIYETNYDSTYSTESPLKIGIANYNKAFEIDNLYVRRYAATESTGTLGGLILSSESLSGQPNWMDSNWAYRTMLRVDSTNNNEDLTDFQIPVNIDSKLLIEATKMQADGDDIRFTDSDGTTGLNYWVESGVDTNSTKLWVKLPTLQAKSNKAIYIYYGNAAATANSSFDNVFTKNYNESGITGLWHMDDGSGTTLTDSSGQGNNGTLVNSPTWQATDGGQWGNQSGVTFGTGSHLLFNGTNNVVQINDNSTLKPSNAITLSAWFNTNNKTLLQRIVSKTESGSYQLSLNDTSCPSSTLCFLVNVAGTYKYASIPTSYINNNQWYFVSGTYDGSLVKLYLNGSLVSENAATGTMTHSITPLCIGGESQAGNCLGGGYFNGYIDEVRIYERALSALDIKSYFERRKSTFIAPNVSIDNVTPTSSLPNWDENGKFGKAISFDGQDDFVQIPSDDSISPTKQMTVGAWIKPMALNGWLYTKAISMYPPTAYDDYQVKVTLNSGNFDYGKAKPDASDLRFSDSRGNQLKYWIEKWDQQGTSLVWIKVAKTGTNKIFMYYGNSDATAETSFDGVFTKNFNENNIVGLWHMDEGSGGTTADISGFNHTATLNNTPTWQGTDGGQWGGRADVKFASGSHLNFNGSNQYLSVPDSDDWDFGTGDFTIDFWINIPSNATSQTIIGNRHTAGANSVWNIEFYSTANRIEWHTQSTVVGNSSATLLTNKWNHVVFTRSSGSSKFYINGTNTNTFSNTYNYNSGQTLYIGKDGSNSTGQLNGYLDEVRVIKGRALSAQEILTQYERRLFFSNEPTTSVAVENTPPPSTNLYSRTIDIDPATTKENYVAKLELTPSNYDYAKSRPDGGDLRFVDDQRNNLNYYIQNWNSGGTSTIFIKIPNTGTSAIKMYYGDKSLINLSNCANTMTLCDDFGDGQFDNDKWSKVRLDDPDWNEGVTETGWFMLKALNGKNLGDGNNTAPMILSNDLGNIDYELTARLKFNPAPFENEQQAGLIIYEDENNYLLADIGNIDGGKAKLAVEDDASMVAFGDNWTIPAVSDLKIVKTGNNYKFYYKDANSSSWIEHSSEIAAEMNKQQIGFTALATAGSTISSYFDHIEIKEISTESNLSLETEQSWTYKRSVGFNPSVPDDDWQVRVDLTSSNFDYGHAKSDGSDLRFFTLDGEKLDYWIEKFNDSGNSVVWVKVPEAGTNEILMYYGNNNAVTESNGERIFEFFDDFNNGVIDSSKWANTTGFTESGGYLSGGNTTNRINTVARFSGDKILETKHFVSTEATNGHMAAGWFNSTTDSFGLRLNPSNTWYIRSDGNWSGSNSFTFMNQWIKAIVSATGSTSKIRLYRESDGVYSNEISYSNSGLSNEPITLGKQYDNANAGQTYVANWDWIFVRKKYTSNAEPTSTLSEEERWLFRKNITLTPATPLADYQVKIELNSGNFDYGSTREDGGDIRFFDSNGSALSYWVERWDKNGTSVIWVKVPTIGTSTIQIVYGNQTAESQSNGENTFDFFDDFDDHSLDADKWSWTRESAGDWNEGYDRPDQLSMTALNGKNLWGTDDSAPILLENNTNFPIAADFELMVSTETDLTQNYEQAGLIVYESDLTHVQAMRGYNDGAKVTFKYEADNSVVAAVDENQTSNYTDLKLRKSGNDYTMYYKNIENAGWTQHGTNISAVINNLKFGLTSYADSGANANSFYDNVRLRKYSTNDPVATVGTQQEASAVVTNNMINKGTQFSLGATDEKVYATMGSQTIEGVIDTDWNHVALTYDGETQKLFVNGQLKQSLEYDLPTWPLDDSDLIIGDQYYGAIDDLLISKRAMSETEIKDWYESGVAYEKKQPTENQLLGESEIDTITSGLIGRWNMNETMGIGVNDSSGHNHHGSAINAKIVEGREGKARNFVADNDYVSIPDSTEFNLSGDYSMSAWINPDNIAMDDRGIMGTYNGSSNGFIFSLGSSTSGNPTLNFWSNGTWNNGPAITMDGTWKHVVFTKQNNVGTFYLDSEAKAVVTAYQINDGGSMQIGAGGTSWASNRFDGRIDDTRIYNRALTPTEVYKLAHEFDPRWTSEQIASQASMIQVSGNQENPQHEVAIKIITPGPAGIATYKTSIDGGMTWSEATYTTSIGTSTVRRDYTNTGVDIDWNFGTDFGSGDVFDIASWYTEPRSASRGISRTFPEVANIVATDKSIEILDKADNSLWMRFTNSADSGYLGGSTTNIGAVDMTYGHLVAGSNTASNSIGLLDIDFSNEKARYYRNNSLPEILTGNIMNRNFGNELMDDNNLILNNTIVNDVAAKMINNDILIAAATEGGLNVINKNIGQIIYGANGANSLKKVALSNNANAVINQTGDANIALSLDNISNYHNDFDLENRNEAYLGTTASGWQSDYQLTNDADTGTVNDLAINDNNWLADEASPQILIGTNTGASLIDTMSNNDGDDTENKRHDGFIKHLNNQYITEGMNGNGLIKGMWLEGDQTETVVSDRSGQANDLTVHGFLGNGTLTNNDWTNGVRGKSLNFDGNNDYLAINDNIDFDFTNNDTVSFGAWVRPKAAAEKYIFAQSDGSATDTSFGLKTKNSGTGINFQGNIGFGSDLSEVDSKEYPLDVWHYVVGVMDGKNQTLSIYIDGQLEEDVTTPAGINNPSNPVTIGWAEGASKYFEGNISGVFLTNNVLTKNQINKMYQVGLGALNDNADDLNKIGGTSNDIRAVALDDDNYRAFLGTATGLSEIDLLKDSRTQYWNITTSPALPNNYVKTISYGSNRILVGTNSGVINIRTDGSYTSSDTLGKLQSGKGRDVFTDGAYNYYVSDKGLDIVKLSDMSRKGYVTREDGFNSVVAFGGMVYMGSEVGVWKANITNVVDEYDLTSAAYTNLSVPQLISNNVYDVHGRIIGGKQYLVVGTDNGAQLIGDIDGEIKYTVFRNNENDDITKVWLNEDGDLAYYNATDKTVCVYNNAIDSELYYMQLGTSSYTRRYDLSTTPRLIDNVVNDLVYMANTSTAQAGGNTLYIGTKSGTTVIQEHSTMASSTVKHLVSGAINDDRTGILLPFADHNLAPATVDNAVYNSVNQFDSGRQKFNFANDRDIAAFWDFDQTMPGGVADRSGNNNNGYFGSDTGLAGGKIGQGLYLNGNGSYLLANDEKSLHPTSAFTWEGWVWKDPAVSNRQAEEPILASKYDGGNNGEFVVYYNKNNKLQLRVADGSSNALSNESSLVSPLNWHHVVVTFDSGVVKFYIDGALDMTQTLSVTNLTKPPYNNNPTTMSDLYLGNDWQLTKGAFVGYFDEVAYYTRALTFEEIQNHFSITETGENGVTVNNQDTLAYPTAGLITTSNNAQELMNLNFDETLADSHGATPTTMIETSWQRPTLNQISYGGNTNNNIVLDLGVSGNWDDAGLHTPEIIREGNTYKMWYAGTDGTNYRIGLATSFDGITWTKFNGNNCTGTTGNGCVFDISSSGFDSQYLMSPSIIKDGNGYHMWYSGYNGGWGIGYATSADGVNWMRQNSGNTVLSLGGAGSWDNLVVAHPSVMKEGTLYKMWYEGSGSNYLIGLATSTDGVNWTKYDNANDAACGYSEANDDGCLVGLGASGEFDSTHLQTVNIQKYQKKYYLFYSGDSAGSFTHKLGLMTSDNGIDWTRENDGDQIMDWGTSGAWDDFSLRSPAAIIQNNQMMIFYAGNDSTDQRIGLATMDFDPGRFGKSLYIGNNDQYIYSLNDKINRRAGTISFWAKLDNVADGLHEVFNIFDKDNGQDGLYLAMQNNQIAVGLNGEQNILTGKADLTNNYWNQVTLSWEKPSANNKNLRLYVNGQLIDSVAFASPISSGYDSIQLGGNPAESRDYLKGNLDDFRIYSQAVGDDAAKELYEGSWGNSSKRNQDFDSNSATVNPISEGTIEFIYTSDWSSAGDNNVRVLADSLGGDGAKYGSQYQNSQTAFNRLRIWKDEGTEANTSDRLHFGILDNDGDLYEIYTNETIDFAQGTSYKIAAMWDLDNNDLTTGGSNIMRLIVDNAVVAGDNFTTGTTANKKKNGSDTSNTEPIIVTAAPERFYIGSGKPNKQTNRLANPSFEEKTGSDPSNWNKTGTINFDQTGSNSKFAASAVSITGPDTTNKLSQTISGAIPGTYTLSWWSKGTTATATQKVYISYPSSNQTVNNDPGTNYVYNQTTFTTTATGNVTVELSADAGETVWFDGLTLVRSRLDENYQNTSSIYSDFKTTNFLMSQEELNAETLAQTYNTTNKNASLAGETNNVEAIAVKKVNTNATAADDILFVGTKGYYSEGAVTQITFGTTDQRTNEYRQTSAGTGLTSNRINSLSYSQVRNNLAVATDDAGIFGFLEETPAVITITSPIGGEEWEGGSSHNITWITDGVCDHVDIDLSTDSGTTFNQSIVTSLADAGSYTWDPIASVNSDQARVRVECEDIMGNILASDISANDYVIDSTKPTVTLNAISNPNGDNVIYGRGTASDTGGATSVSQIQYKIDSNDWNTALITANPGTTNVEYDFSTTALGGGEHTIYVRAKDSSLPGGNETDQTMSASRSFNVDELSVNFSKTSFDANLDVGDTGIFNDSLTITVSGFGTAYNIGIKANDVPTHNIYDSEIIPFYTGNDNWSSNTKGFGWRYQGYNNGYYNAFPLTDYQVFYTGKANTNGVPTQVDFKAVADWTVDAGTYNSSVSVIVTPRY